MGSFIRLERLDPYQTFVSTLREGRPVMEKMYYGAFEAFTKRNDLLNESLWAQCNHGHDLEYELLGVSFNRYQPVGDPLRLHSEAQIMDLQADQFASMVVCFGDDTIQRFRRSVLGGSAALYPGYGPTYLGERLSTILRVGSNAYRHVSEWDDMFERLPYPELCEVKEGSSKYQAVQNIQVIQRTFGIGKHDMIRDPISWRVICTIDGQFGSAPPSYDRFEEALIDAARDIASSGGKRAMATLAAELETWKTQAVAS